MAALSKTALEVAEPGSMVRRAPVPQSGEQSAPMKNARKEVDDTKTEA